MTCQTRVAVLFVRQVAAAALLVAGLGTASAQADPATASSLPWKILGGGPIAVSGSTVYYTGLQPVPRANTGHGLAVFPASEAIGEAVAGGGDVYTVIPDGSGGWYVGGTFTTFGGLPRSKLAHVLASGAIDPAFVANIDSGGYVFALARSGGQLIVGGGFSTVNLVPRANLAIVDATTGLVQAVAPTLNGFVNAIAVSGTTVVVGGRFTTAGGLTRRGLAAFRATDGVLLPLVANLGVGESVESLAIDGSAVYVAGSFLTVNGVTRRNLAKVDLVNGFVDPAWSPNANDLVRAVSVDGGVVYAGGFFTNVGGQPRTALAALNTTTGLATSWRADTEPGAYVTGLTAQSGALYAVGVFESVGGVARHHVAAIGTSAPAAVLPWNPSVGPLVRAVAAAGGRIAVAGDIEGWGTSAPGSMTAVNTLTGDLLPFAPVLSGSVRAMIATGQRLVIGGNFRTVDGNSRNRLAAFALDTHELLPLSIAIDGPIMALAAIGDVLYIGGQFTIVNSAFRLNLAAIDMNTGAVLPWDPQADVGVYSMLARGDRVVVAGGFSSLIGATGTNGFNTRMGLGEIMAVGAGNAGAVTPFDAGLPSGAVATMDLSGTSLYFSGSFSLVGATPRAFAAAVNVNTGTLLPWNPVLGASGNSISVRRGSVYLTGTFTTVGGQPRAAVARVNDTTGALSAWVPAQTFDFADAVVATDAGVALSADTYAGFDADHYFPEQAVTGAPGPPTQPAARIIGSSLTLAWQPPVMGPRPTSYLLEAGTAPGASNLGTLPLGTTTFAVGGVPPGTFYVRMRAVGAGGVGAASRELTVTVGAAGCTTPPLAPTVPVVTVAGGTVVLNWSASSGSAPTAYTMQVGTADGLANLGALAVGGATSLSTGGVPPGAFFVRLVAANGCGLSPATADAIIRVGGAPGPPGQPLQFTGTTAAGVTSLAWLTSASGGVPTSHVLEAGTGPGLANLGTIPLGAATGLAVPGVPPGTYYLRVRALNATGPSPVSGELLLVVP